MRRRRLFQTTAAALTVGIAGCWQEDGDSTDVPMDEPDDTLTPSATPEATSTSTELSADEPNDTPSRTAAQAAQVVDVGPAEDNFSFAPASFEIAPGDTVLWVWQSGGHNVVVEKAPDGADWKGKPDDTYDEGYEYSHTFTTVGEYKYYCAPHEGLGMKGAFTVTE